MPAAVIPISRNLGAKRYGNWSLVELARPGHAPVPLGILLLEDNTDELSFLLRDASEIEDLDESDQDVIEALPADLKMKAREMGGNALLRSLEESLSHFLRISDRTAISFAGSPQVTVNQLFDEHVETEVRPFITHLPVYSLKAAATKFGGEGEAEQLDWARVPKGLRLNEGMFIAQVVGRSMEPLIPDGSYCVFRTPVTGTRQGKRLLIELFGSDATGRYTVKRYTSIKSADPETGEWQHERIRLEPLNREFEAFDLAPDQFKVIAEFVQVLPS